MNRLSQLTDNIRTSEQAWLLPKRSSVYFRWIHEATYLIQELQTKVEKLEKVEQGLIPFSNDPTELEIAQSQLEGMPKRKLHSFVTGEIIEEGGMPRIYCAVCHVDLSVCGATEDSWYCD